MSLALTPAPDWLVARPVAHRGLHERAAGRVENTLGAARAAIAHGFSIECDVQISADGEAMVFHDDDLARLVGREGLVREVAAERLAATALLDAGGETIPRLSDLLETVAGRVPLVVEIKSRFDGDMRLVHRTLALAQAYSGPIALKSFDPAIVAEIRRLAPQRVRGIVAEARYDHREWDGLTSETKRALASLDHVRETQPHFLSWGVRDLPHAAPFLLRALAELPVMVWTVRDADARARAQAHADQMVFEGFVP
ncbi:glycerophosphodiester phosphodiesterase family protein [Salinarimonas sp.]|uniref:glycerophosphodiester phosphodiesterase family protein n=1 Tax=Salinarimonas sp. TaxID=2766526 RepID=UPI00391AFDC9